MADGGLEAEEAGDREEEAEFDKAGMLMVGGACCGDEDAVERSVVEVDVDAEEGADEVGDRSLMLISAEEV